MTNDIKEKNDEKPLVQAIAQDPLQPTSGTARHRARQPPDEHDDDHRDHLMNMMWMTNLMVKMVIEMVKISMLIMMIEKMIKINGDMMMRNIYYQDGHDVNNTRPPIHTRLDSAHPSSSSVRNQGFLCTDEIDDYRDDGDYISDWNFMNQSVAT